MKKIRGIIIGIVILLVFGNALFLTAKEEQPLTTGITKIVWEKVEYESLNQNYSNFEFTINYDILNPNEENVTLTYPGSAYEFKANVSAQFKDKQLTMYDYTSFVGYPAEREENITSGITSKSTSYRIGINKKNITELPEGIYYFWIKAYNSDETEVKSNITTLIVKNGNPTIYYNIETTIIMGKSLVFIFVSNLFILPTIRIAKYRKEVEKLFIIKSN